MRATRCITPTVAGDCPSYRRCNFPRVVSAEVCQPTFSAQSTFGCIITGFFVPARKMASMSFSNTCSIEGQNHFVEVTFRHDLQIPSPKIQAIAVFVGDSYFIGL
jgi:hypothetical protein